MKRNRVGYESQFLSGFWDFIKPFPHIFKCIFTAIKPRVFLLEREILKICAWYHALFLFIAYVECLDPPVALVKEGELKGYVCFVDTYSLLLSLALPVTTMLQTQTSIGSWGTRGLWNPFTWNSPICYSRNAFKLSCLWMTLWRR